MARFRRLQVLLEMEKAGVIPVFYEPDYETAKNIVTACSEGGATCIEWTNRGDGAHEVFSQLERFCKSELPQVILGVGSIIDAPTAAIYIAEGANFVVGPLLDEETAFLCNKRKIPYSPGCASMTEIHRAHELGVEIIKIFPGAQIGGPEFLKSAKGPCPWISIMVTGGIDPTRESITTWFDAGITCAGIGSNLITKELIAKGDFHKISMNIKKVMKIVEEVRGKKSGITHTR